MHAQEKISLAAIAIGASVCDRKLNDKERCVVNTIFNELKLSEEERGLAYRRVFFSPPSMGALVRAISSPEGARGARELALKVCQADGTMQPEEVSFLEGLGEETDITKLSVAGPTSTSPHNAEHIIQHFARVSEAIRNRAPVLGTIFLSSLRLQLFLKLRGLYRAGKKVEIDEVRMMMRLQVLSLSMRPYALSIAHSDSPFHGKASELPENANEGFTDYLVTYAFGCLLEEYYENRQTMSGTEWRGTYFAAMLRGRFTRESNISRSPKLVGTASIH